MFNILSKKEKKRDSVKRKLSNVVPNHLGAQKLYNKEVLTNVFCVSVSISIKKSMSKHIFIFQINANP